MKHLRSSTLLLVFCLITLVVFSAGSARSDERIKKLAVPGAISHGQHITKVIDLPNESKFERGGYYFDLGWLHERVSIKDVPFWGSVNGQYIYYTRIRNDYYYFLITELDAIKLARSQNIALQEGPPISHFSNQWGIYLFCVVVALLIFIVNTLSEVANAIALRREIARETEMKTAFRKVRTIEKTNEKNANLEYTLKTTVVKTERNQSKRAFGKR